MPTCIFIFTSLYCDTPEINLSTKRVRSGSGCGKVNLLMYLQNPNLVRQKLHVRPRLNTVTLTMSREQNRKQMSSFVSRTLVVSKSVPNAISMQLHPSLPYIFQAWVWNSMNIWLDPVKLHITWNTPSPTAKHGGGSIILLGFFPPYDQGRKPAGGWTVQMNIFHLYATFIYIGRRCVLLSFILI